MHIPFDEGLGIHPQDDFFLDREVWDLSRTPEELRPLMLHYHPLVIYRFQVLKQADVVLALFLQGDRFTAEEKRKDFEYYDPITTGDSTLSAVVQSVVAAEVGYHEVALRLLPPGPYVDLANLHGNTVDGLHVASTGGVWSALVNGFGGMRDHDGRLSFDPRLPDGWTSLTFRFTWRGTRVRVTLTGDLPDHAGRGGRAAGARRGARQHARRRRPARRSSVALDGHGPADRRARSATARRRGGTRADGSRITAGVPDPMPARGRRGTGGGHRRDRHPGPRLPRALDGGTGLTSGGGERGDEPVGGGIRIGTATDDVVGERVQPGVAAEPPDPGAERLQREALDLPRRPPHPTRTEPVDAEPPAVVLDRRHELVDPAARRRHGAHDGGSASGRARCGRPSTPRGGGRAPCRRRRRGRPC